MEEPAIAGTTENEMSEAGKGHQRSAWIEGKERRLEVLSHQAHGETSSACCAVESLRGGDRERSWDPQLPQVGIPRGVMKGGSHLCAPNDRRRYRPAARMRQPIDTAASRLGFRCIVRV